MPFEIGDRVSSQIDYGKPERKTGTVRAKRKSAPSSTSASFWLYDVEFDTDEGRLSRGHQEAYLQRETTSMGGLHVEE